jgi:hypothetical protein
MKLKPRRLRSPLPEIAAGLCGVTVALLAVVLLHQLADGGSADGAQPATGTTLERHLVIPVTTPQALSARVAPRDVAAVATADLVKLGDSAAATAGRVRRTVDSVTVGPLRIRAEHAMPLVVAQIHARLIKSSAPSVFRELPLGYRLGAIDSTRATISIWHVDIAASSALPLTSATYTTTTYRLVRLGGVWRIENIQNASGPTPPGSQATASTIDAFARYAGRFSRYRYAP